MNVGQLRKLLEANSDLPDSAKVVVGSYDHSYREVNLKVCEILIDRGKNLAQWYGNPVDFGYEGMEDFKADGNQVVKALVV